MFLIFSNAFCNIDYPATHGWISSVTRNNQDPVKVYHNLKASLTGSWQEKSQRRNLTWQGYACPYETMFFSYFIRLYKRWSIYQPWYTHALISKLSITYGGFRNIKASYINLATPLTIFWSLHFNNSTALNIDGRCQKNFGINFFLISLYKGHSSKKWYSSSNWLQVVHSRSLRGVTGLVQRPVSIRNEWLDTKNLVIAILCLFGTTIDRYSLGWWRGLISL